MMAGSNGFIGRYPRPFFMPVRLLGEDELARQLVFSLRLPRIIAIRDGRVERDEHRKLVAT